MEKSRSLSVGDKLQAGALQFSEIAKQAQPYLQKLEPFLRAAYPYCHILKEHALAVYRFLRPYYNQEVAEIATALVLLFFGGHFAMTIACWQAFKVSGSRLISKSWKELQASYTESKLALEKDDETRELFDHDGDGTIGPIEMVQALKEIATAKTEEEKTHARRKAMVIMKCIDPNKILDASLGMWTGIIAVLATLRSRFIHCISLGASVGQRVGDTIVPMVQPKLYDAFPQHQKWVDFCLRTASSGVGVIFSLLLIRVISAFNSALQGSHLLVTTLTRAANEKGWLGGNTLTEEQRRIATWCAAMVGFLAQLQSGFNLPFLLKLPLMPVIIGEYLLTLIAAR